MSMHNHRGSLRFVIISVLTLVLNVATVTEAQSDGAVSPLFSHTLDLLDFTESELHLNILSLLNGTTQHNLIVKCDPKLKKKITVEVYPVANLPTKFKNCNVTFDEKDGGVLDVVSVDGSSLSATEEANDCSAEYILTLPAKLSKFVSALDVTSVGARASSVVLSDSCEDLHKLRLAIQVASTGGAECEECVVNAEMRGSSSTSQLAMAGGSRAIATVNTPRFYATVPFLDLVQVVPSNAMSQEDDTDMPSMNAIVSRGANIEILLPPGMTVFNAAAEGEVELVASDSVATALSGDTAQFRVQLGRTLNSEIHEVLKVRLSAQEGAVGAKGQGSAITPSRVCTLGVAMAIVAFDSVV